MVYTLGGSGKLPPVMMNSMCDKSYARSVTSGFYGKIAVHYFIYPPDTCESTSNIFAMNEFMQKDNP